MLIHRSIPSRHSSHRWQHELKRVQWTKQKRLMLVSHREKQVHLLQTNTIESIANEAAFYSCIGAASSNSMQKYETRDQRCLLIPAHLIFHFCPFENKNPVMAAATNFNNNNAIDEEDRMLLEQDTPVFSEATVDNDLRETGMELDMEVSGIFATSPDASPVTRVESSVVMSPTVLLTPSSSPASSVTHVDTSLDCSGVFSRSSSAPSSVSTVETSLDGVQSTALSPSSSPASSVTHVTDSLDSASSSLHCPHVDSETMDTDADSEATESDSSSLSLHCPKVESSSTSSSSSSSTSTSSSSTSSSSSPSSPSSSDKSTLLIPVFPERDTPAPSRPAAVVDGTQCPVEDIEVVDRLDKCCFTRLTCSGHEQRSVDHLVPHGGVPGVLRHAEPGGLGDTVAQRVPPRAAASADHRGRVRAVPEDASTPRPCLPALHPDGPDHPSNPRYAAAVHGGTATTGRRPSSWTRRIRRAGQTWSRC